MKYYYFDSSALVKRYAPEKGTQRVDAIFQEKDRVLIIANIGIVEIYSALSKKKREKEINNDGELKDFWERNQPEDFEGWQEGTLRFTLPPKN